MMRISIVTVLAASLLASCATPEERAAQAAREVDRMVQIYGPACEKLGFKSNTDPWRNCIIGLGQKDAAHGYYNDPFYGPPFWHSRYGAY
jgi:hypothetical protein